MIANKKEKNLKSELNIANEYLSDEDYYAMVAKSAYSKAEQRNFVEGDELSDWYEAEQEVNQQNFYRFLS